MDKDNIAVSVIVPVHNAEKYLYDTMESLVHQSMKNIEILCIDNGSTDDSVKILLEYEKVYPNVTVYTQTDHGQAYSMNRGLRLARGEYVAECDSDDFVQLRMYEKLYEVAEHKADVVRCGFYGLWDTGFIQPNVLNVPEQYMKVNPQELKGIAQSVVFGKMCSLFTGIYRRQFLLDNELFWREGKNYEDTCLEFKIKASATDYRFLNECLYYYRRGNEGSGSATIKDEFAICEQYDEIRAFDKDGKFADYMNSLMYYSYLWSLSRTPEERKFAFVEKMEADFKLHPGKRKYFNNDADWANYCTIRLGDWREVGVKA